MRYNGLPSARTSSAIVISDSGIGPAIARPGFDSNQDIQFTLRAENTVARYYNSTHDVYRCGAFEDQSPTDHIHVIKFLPDGSLEDAEDFEVYADEIFYKLKLPEAPSMQEIKVCTTAFAEELVDKWQQGKLASAHSIAEAISLISSRAVVYRYQLLAKCDIPNAQRLALIAEFGPAFKK